MEMNFSKEVFGSQAYNSFRIIEATALPSGGAQASYYIPEEMFTEYKEHGILVKSDIDDSSLRIKGDIYKLRDDIKLVLSDAIIAIIGDEYRRKDNKFIVQYASSNLKPTLAKSTFSNLGDDYKWFVDLYDNNCVGSCVLYTYSDTTNEFIIDVKYNCDVVSFSSNYIGRVAHKDMTIEELGAELALMYNNPKETGKTTAVHMFGLKYADIIIKNSYSFSDILEASGIKNSDGEDTHYDREIRKAVRMYKSIASNEYGVIFRDEDLSDDTTKSTGDTKSGLNIIYYGVPGCGKSHYIKTHYAINKGNSYRIVFHPDYTYADFVGQILPKKSKDDDGRLEYPFVSGPFTNALRDAYKNKLDNQDNPENVYLIIEEINRGNAPAIFGDVFQLLDRDRNGASEYGIKNPDIAAELGIDKNEEIRIPNNLIILATMNTADQNVFTLDTAFKRRWKFIAVPNDFDDDKVKAHVDKHLLGDNKYPTWKEFATKVNDIIISKNDIIGSSDKRLGVFFLRDNEIINEDDFSEKVLMYLWNDVFTLDRSSIFRNNYNSLEKLINDFKGAEKFNVFNVQWDNASTSTEVIND